jgi:raffinose/stachyose/melibiose transport system permease protein
MTNRWSHLPTRAILALAAVSVIVPLLVIVSSALQSPDSLDTALAWPAHPYWGNFADAWSMAGFASLFKSSVIVTLGVVPAGVILATLAGYAFATMDFYGKGVIFAVLLVGMTMPYEAIVIPLYYDLTGMGLANTYLALIFPLIGAFMPFGALWMRTQFASIPRSLIEAAQTDGASSLRILIRVLLPNVRPALATLAVLYFMWSWNQFLLALILIQDPSKRTAPAGLGKFVTQYTTNIPLLSAGTLIVITPVVVVYLLFQRQFLTGMSQGALKG